VTLSIRSMLTLRDDSTLNTEEIWLKKAYSNILMNLIQATITSNTSSEFDPFISKYVGIDSVKYNKFEYQALLEVTSFSGHQKAVVESC
jgi:hypothetical protein